MGGFKIGLQLKKHVHLVGICQAMRSGRNWKCICKTMGSIMTEWKQRAMIGRHTIVLQKQWQLPKAGPLQRIQGL